MLWLLPVLRFVHRILKYLAGKPAVWTTSHGRFQGRWTISAYYHWILDFVHAVLQRQLARARGTLIPKPRDGCSCCVKLPTGPGQHYLSLLQFQEAASQSCIRCSTFLKCVLNFSDRWQGALTSDVQIDRRSLTLYVNEQSPRIRWPNRSTKALRHPDHGYNTLHLRILYGERTVSGKDISGSEFGLTVPTNSRSELCFKFIQSQVAGCLRDHQSCNSNRQTSFAPKLLIDIEPEGFPGSGGTGDVRLVETSSLKNRVLQYSALSYCWGDESALNKPIPKLTIATVQNRLCGIPWAELTKTFEDAIIIARRMSIRYLWIDALCIRQDDKQDFAEQSSQMALIYGNAYLVISATRAANGDIGIFHDRVGPYKVPYIDVKNRYSLADVKEAYFHGEFSVNDPHDFRRSPVFSRAWCFQERLLARRIIHFADDELVWECNEQLQCECGSLNGAIYSGVNFKTRQARRLLPPKDTASPEAELNMRDSLWHECIHTYTSRHLTNESDRLPALSGFARELSIPQMGRYVAGFWEFQLPSALLWYITHPHLGSKDTWVHRPKDNQAPTWSWSSIQGVILLRHVIGRNVVAKVQEIECLPSTADRFGQVQAGAFIFLEVPVLAVKLVSYGSVSTQWGDRQCGYIEPLPPAGGYGEGSTPEYVDRKPCPFLPDLDLKVPGRLDHVAIGARLTCAVIDIPGRPEDGDPPKCLILRKERSRVGHASSYCRLGTFDCPERWLAQTLHKSIRIY